jgi:hypothetical protein
LYACIPDRNYSEPPAGRLPFDAGIYNRLQQGILFFINEEQKNYWVHGLKKPAQ